jgi:hypothetical protein
MSHNSGEAVGGETHGSGKQAAMHSNMSGLKGAIISFGVPSLWNISAVSEDRTRDLRIMRPRRSQLLYSRAVCAPYEKSVASIDIMLWVRHSRRSFPSHSWPHVSSQRSADLTYELHYLPSCMLFVRGSARQSAAGAHRASSNSCNPRQSV